jgi:hypothetical protein
MLNKAKEPNTFLVNQPPPLPAPRPTHLSPSLLVKWNFPVSLFGFLPDTQSSTAVTASLPTTGSQDSS